LVTARNGAARYIASGIAGAALFFVIRGGGDAGALHPYGVDDWSATRFASGVAVAPDGATILYEHTQAQRKGTDKHTWWLVRTNGTATRALKIPKDFTPLGFTTTASQLYGIASVKDVKQLALFTIGARRAKVLTTFGRGINGASLSPDGTRIGVIADARPADPLAQVHVVEENALAELFVVPAAGGVAKRWCPAANAVGGFAWSPDGTRIAALSQTPRIGSHTEASAIDVCSAGSAHRVAQIANATINQIPFPGAAIAWTGGGTTLAFLSTSSNVLTPDHVYTVAAAGGAPRDVTPGLIGSTLSLRGTPRGDVWVLVARGVQNDVERLTASGLQPFLRWPAGNVNLPLTTELARAPATIVADVSDPTHSTNVAAARGGTLAKVTHAGDAQLASVAFGRVVRHRWTSAGGVALEAIVTFPAGHTGQPTRFVVLPHGGPEANDTLRLDAIARIVAGAGFVVMQPQYRGSTGYGTAHMQAIYQHFGDRAYGDVDAATTEAVARGWADPKRLAIFGWSAGGFMTAWTITQTHRYKAAVEGAGITDWYSFIDSSDVEQSDYDARPTTGDPEPFFQFSATRYAGAVKTPLLILHGRDDARVPWVQGFGYFNRLKERAKTVRMISYPGSGHFPREWTQRRDVMTQTLWWLRRYDP
jgi:dipeptidyl aminopeptidase/acylaminoacyl peptidase